MGTDSEGMISDDDMNWGLFCVPYIVYLLGPFTGFLYYCMSTLREYKMQKHPGNPPSYERSEQIGLHHEIAY
jgi:hypothetical protein